LVGKAQNSVGAADGKVNLKPIFLWRPTFIIALFVVVLWRELTVSKLKIPQGEANKSANRWDNLHAKGGVVLPSVFKLPYSCEHQI
jgi:hypothetical protein